MAVWLTFAHHNYSDIVYEEVNCVCFGHTGMVRFHKVLNTCSIHVALALHSGWSVETDGKLYM